MTALLLSALPTAHAAELGNTFVNGLIASGLLSLLYAGLKRL